MLSSDPSIVSFYCDDCKAKFPPRIFEDKTNLWERPRPKPHPDEGAIAQFHEACSASFALFLFDFDALKPSSFMGFLIQAFLLQYCLKPETSERTTFSGDAMSTGVRFLFAVQILGWATGLFPDYMTDSLVGHKIPIIIGVLRMISTLCFVIGLSGYIFVGIDPILHRRAVNDTESSE